MSRAIKPGDKIRPLGNPGVYVVSSVVSGPYATCLSAYQQTNEGSTPTLGGLFISADQVELVEDDED